MLIGHAFGCILCIVWCVLSLHILKAGLTKKNCFWPVINPSAWAAKTRIEIWKVGTAGQGFSRTIIVRVRSSEYEIELLFLDELRRLYSAGWRGVLQVYPESIPLWPHRAVSRQDGRRIRKRSSITLQLLSVDTSRLHIDNRLIAIFLQKFCNVSGRFMKT